VRQLKSVILEHVSRRATITTDDLPSYRGIGDEFDGGHVSVNHSLGQCVDGLASTYTAESCFSLLERGLYGTFHSVSKKHLHRYLAEFDFRYNRRKITDGARTHQALAQVGGKRLMYRDSSK
jgi:transposase-like protein